MSRSLGVVAVGILLAAACSGDATDDLVEQESVLRADIAGTTGGELTVASDGRTATVLYDVVGDWTAVSVEIAGLATEEGWTVESIRCVGTGNDVIARKRVANTWLLLESGAGTAGAGLIVSIPPDQRGPREFRVTGGCPDALITEARP